MGSIRHNNSLCSENQLANNYYNHELEHNPYKHLFVIISLLIIVVSVAVSTLIIWYEKFGSVKKRTIINQLVSLICWNLIYWSMFIQGAGIARFLYGSFNQTFCFWLVILRRTITTKIIILFDAITTIRFIFICCLQNPGAFNDDFWNLFLNIWITGMCFLNQFVNASLPNLTLFQYTICVGHPPLKSINSVVANFGLEIFSLLLQIILYSFIKSYKNKKPKDLMMKVFNLKRSDLAFIEKRSLLGFSFNIFLIMAIIFILTSVLASKSIQSSLDVENSSSLFVPFSFLVFPCILPLLISGAIFNSNSEMRQAMFKEVKINVWNPIIQNLLLWLHLDRVDLQA